MPKAGTGSACFWECPPLLGCYPTQNPTLKFCLVRKKKKAKRKVFPTNLSWSRHNQLDNLSAFVFIDFSKHHGQTRLQSHQPKRTQVQCLVDNNNIVPFPLLKKQIQKRQTKKKVKKKRLSFKVSQ
jgi:hypothetical protein